MDKNQAHGMNTTFGCWIGVSEQWEDSLMQKSHDKEEIWRVRKDVIIGLYHIRRSVFSLQTKSVKSSDDGFLCPKIEAQRCRKSRDTVPVSCCRNKRKHDGAAKVTTLWGTKQKF